MLHNILPSQELAAEVSSGSTVLYTDGKLMMYPMVIIIAIVITMTS